MINVSRKNIEYKCEPIKSARLSTGIMVHLFRVVSSPDIHARFLVGVRRLHQGRQSPDDTLHFLRFIELRAAVSAYLDYICEYA